MRPLSALQLLLWHSALWTVRDATPLGPARNLPETFLLKCLEQVRKIQADVVAMQERLVSEGLAARQGGHTRCRVDVGERGPRRELREGKGSTGKARGQGRKVGEGEP